VIGAGSIVDQFRAHGVTDVVGLPDNASKALLDRLGAEPAIRIVTVTREGEAFAIASGLWVGGREPLVLIQNTGLLESGDAIRGTAMRMRVPLVCLVTCRGYGRMSVTTPLDADLLSRPDLDSVALLTEPTLRAWAVDWETVARDEDVPRVGTAFRRAREGQRPVAVLITGETSA
jgi:sulfopyruvate decarboxylase subunit alpha